MDYTPPTAKAPEPLKPVYELTTDVTGKPPPKRGPTIIKDLKGNAMKMPYAPKPNCKKCYGRGYIGTDPRTNAILLCKKCYPMVK
jgi:hypothetical protein